jgi:DtxR family transcriptional regulator, Mn-dependent transcriptional regulator
VTVPKEKTEKNLDNYFFGCKLRWIKLSFFHLKKVGAMNSKQAGGISTDKLTPTMEDYLEAIYNLSQEKKVVRVKDIAKRLGVKMPTVTSMLKTLGEKGMIDHEKYEYLELTGKGSDIGSEIDQRHQTLKTFLTDILKIDHDQADKDACKMEHAVSPATLESIVEFMAFIENCPRGGNDWLDLFNEYRKHGAPRDKCLERMKRFAHEYDAKIKDMERER